MEFAMFVPKKIINKLYLLGFNSFISCVVSQLYLALLQFFIGFDRWHVKAPFHCRPYKAQIVEIANSIEVKRAVEIGCGLGEIISKLVIETRIGIDADMRVIRAAQIMYGARCSFFPLTLKESINCLPEAPGSETLLIMVNWIHNMTWDELDYAVKRLKRTQNIGFILVDGILPGQSGYQFHYNESDFSKWGTILSILRSRDNVRNFFVVKV